MNNKWEISLEEFEKNKDEYRKQKLCKKLTNDDLLFLGRNNKKYELKKDISLNDINRHIQNFSISERKIKHISENDSYFFKEQFDTYIKLSKEGKYFLQAQTSFGKTMLIKELVFNKQESLNKIVIIVPTINLKTELVREFNKLFFKKIRIITDFLTDEKIDDQKYIIISTQETLSKANWIVEEKIDLLVIDEAYNINAKKEFNSRTVVLNKILDNLIKNNNYVIMLSPLIGKISEKTLDFFF